MSRLRAVLFDIDDTLVPTTRFAARARTNAVRAMIEAGLDLPEKVVAGELAEVISEFSSNYDHHFDKLLMRLRPPSLAERNSALIVAAGIAAYHDTKFRELAPFPDVIPLLQFLREAGLITGVLTHGWTMKQAEKLVRLGLVPYLDPRAIFISDQVGVSKPNPKLWQIALDDLDLAPQEVMYVGDSPEADIAPPSSLGIVTVWSKRAARRKLEGTGIEPNHVVSGFDDLRDILLREYSVDAHAG